MNRKEEVARMADEIERYITVNYVLKTRERVHQLLSEITLEHVMASSEWNLLQTRKAILILAAGDLHMMPDLVRAAKSDFRDVILWATQKNQKS